MVLFALLACTPPHPCAEGELVTDDGDCVPLNGGGNNTHTPDDTDGETGTEPLDLSDSCEALPTGDDPLWLTGQWRHIQSQPGQGILVEFVDVELRGTRGYGAGQGGLQVHDIRDASAPQFLYTFPENGQARFHNVIALDDDHVALSNRDMGVWFANVSSDDRAEEMLWEGGSGMEGLAWEPNSHTLYVTRRDGNLLVVEPADDFTDMDVRDTVGGLGTPFQLTDIQGDWMYAADITAGVVPIDISTPRQPVIHGGVSAPGDVQHAAFYEDALYAAIGGFGVAIYDVSTRQTPQLVGTVETGGSVVQVAAAAGLLWAADHEGVMVWDITDPLEPIAIHRETTEQFALGIDADQNGAWVGDWNLFSGFAADATAQVPKADLPARRLFVSEDGGETVVTVTNRGGAPLNLAGAQVQDVDATIVTDTTRVQPGETATLTVTTPPGPLSNLLCLATDDPDEPVSELLLLSSDPDTLLGQQAPNFCVPDLDGRNYCLEDYAGTPVVLAYFATW